MSLRSVYSAKAASMVETGVSAGGASVGESGSVSAPRRRRAHSSRRP